MMSDPEKRTSIEYFAERKFARVVLNRPQKHNAIDGQMIDEWLAALESLRNDSTIRVVITKGAGRSFGSGLDLHYLRSISATPSLDWQRSNIARTLADTIRDYPKVTIAQVHGYCLGQAMVNMLSHDLAFAADTAQIGMPEIVRGSFGQLATSNLFHAGLPKKKAAMIQLSAQYVSGSEADRLGLVSTAVPEAELEAYTLKLAGEIASRHPAALAAAKVAVQVGNELSVSEAMKTDQLVWCWQRLLVDPASDIESYLRSQAGGQNSDYEHPDLTVPAVSGDQSSPRRRP
jgi:enoyl-CoA hydratase/carnithine racemase